MESYTPIVAIAGSARRKIVGDENREALARAACAEIGQELAKAGWRIAVYGSDADYIEADVVRGFVASGASGKHSIVSYHPQGASVHFQEMNQTDKEYFYVNIDPSSDWEVSFYRSLAKVDGLLLLGGGPSTLIAGQIALSRDLPIIAVAHFGGSALKMWQQHLSSKPAYIEDNDVRVMGRWDANSARELVGSLVGQYNRRQARESAEQKALEGLKQKAQSWDTHLTNEKENKTRLFMAIGFLLVFVVFLIIGLVASPGARTYSLLTIVGLCVAGGMGATVRMLAPEAPVQRKSVAPVLGIAVGLVFSILYLIPQLIQNSGFLIPSEIGITTATRVQYLSALLVAFLAGLGFDFAIEQLLRRARESNEQIISTAATGATNRGS